MIIINPIIDNYPDQISIEGNKIDINTDFRVWLLLYKNLMEDNYYEIGELIFTKIIPGVTVTKEHIKEIMNFFTLVDHKSEEQLSNNPISSRKAQIQNLLDVSNPIFDIFMDSDCIISDFLREYSIDLTSRTLQLHWLHFKLLLNNLSKTSCVSARKELRGLLPKDVPKEKVQELAKIQSQYKIKTKKQQISVEERNKLLMELADLVYKEAVEKLNDRKN